MWSIVDISLDNFKSHEKTYYKFLQGKATMIYGKNYDDNEGADSNGAGKSTIIQGVTIGLLDIPDRQLTKEEYIMDGKGEAVIELNLHNAALKTNLTIIRTIKRKGESSVFLYEDGKINSQLTSISETNEKILEMLDITKEDLLNYYIINQENSHSFFKSTDAKKKEIIARFTNTKILDIVLEEVEADLLINSHKKQGLEQVNVELISKISNIDEQIVYEKEGRKCELEENANYTKEEINDVSKQINSLKEKEVSLKARLTQLDLRLKEIKQPETKNEDLNDKKSLMKNDILSKKQELKETNGLIGELNKILAGTIQCPKCEYEFSVVDKEIDIEQYKQTKTECDNLFISLSEELDDIDTKITKINEEIHSNNEILSSIKIFRTNLQSAKEDIEENRNKANLKQEQLNKLNESLEKYKKFKEDKTRIKDLEDGKNTITLQIKTNIDEIDELHREIEEIIFWKNNFSDSGLKNFLIVKVLENLEGYLNYNLKAFNVNLMIKINGFTINKDGSVREKIDVLVSKDFGKNWKKFQRFSGGQKERINVSGILTLRELINLSSKSGGLDFLALDETMEGLDFNGQRMILPILEQSGVTTLVVSHNNNDIGAENQLWITYEDGISRIE